MAVRSETELGAASRDAVERYLTDLTSGLCAVDSDVAAETIEEVRAHFLERLSADSDADEVELVIRELGEPDEYATQLCSSLSDVPSSHNDADAQGELLGMPYEMRPPSGERVVSRWWNPRDPRVFMPRVFGVGWDLNYGSIAVRLHLIEPDAEDEPFAAVSDATLFRALLIPLALTAFVLGTYLALRSQFPAELPVHWSWDGAPDRFAAPFWAFLLPFAMSAVPTFWATWTVALHRSHLVQAGAIALASLMSTLAAVIWSLTVASALGYSPAGWVFAVAVLASLLVPFALLTSLARIGRAEELRRDLKNRQS